MRAGELSEPGAAAPARRLAARPAAGTARSRAWRRPDAPPAGALERSLAPLLALHDLAAAGVSYAVAFATRVHVVLPLTEAPLPPEAASEGGTLALVLLTQLPLLYCFGLYDPYVLRERVRPLAAPAGAVALQVLAVTAWSFFAGSPFPRSVLLLFALGNLGLVVAGRVVARATLRTRTPLRVALVGPRDEVVQLHAALAPDAERHGIALVGAVRASGPAAESAASSAGPSWLGPLRDLERIARERRLDQLVVVPSASGRDELLDAVLRATAGAYAPRVALVPSVYELRVGRLASLRIDDVPLIEVVRDPERELSFRLKHACDLVAAAVLLVLALPLCVVAGAAIRLGSPGPVLYRQRRVGRGGREFIMYKLRTMRVDAEEASGPVLATEGDARVTAAGRVLRALRIDEVPQLLNVLNGTMSLVGPRPERPELTEALVRDVPGYRERWLVKPGLTGLAQVHGEYHTPPEYKLKYDLAYIHNYSLWLDLRIVLETAKTLLTRRGV